MLYLIPHHTFVFVNITCSEHTFIAASIIMRKIVSLSFTILCDFDEIWSQSQAIVAETSGKIHTQNISIRQKDI